MTKIVDGTADKMGTALQMGAAVVIGFTQGFFFGWKLALVMLAVTPAITFASLLMSMVSRITVLTFNSCTSRPDV